MEERAWHQSYAPGVPKTLDIVKLTMSQVLAGTASKYPGKTAINYMGTRISYRELDGLVNRLARALMGLGVVEGDKVAIILPNIPQAVIAYLAIYRIGAVVVQNNPLYTERELGHQLDDSDSKLAITLSLLIPRLRKIMPGTRVEKIIGCHIHSYLPFPKKQLFPFVKKEMFRKIEPAEDLFVFKDLIRKYSDDPVEDRSDWEELSTMIYTGGTTGVSKGVMLSHANISTNAQQFRAWFPDLEEGEERIVGTFPLFHSAGFMSNNFFILMGWEHIMIPRPESKTIIELLKKQRPTVLPGVPTIFVGLLADPEFRKMDHSNLKGFFSGAAPLAADTIRDLKEVTGATIAELYGLTETSPVVTIAPWGGKVKPGTVGIPVPDTDFKIVDTEDDTRELPVGESGEIAIKGPQVMMGYYKRPDETAKVLRDGWLYTGDIGFFDDEGYLSIVDRKKDMIIAGGYNIYPIEIDNVLFDHPKILEACTIGIPHEYRGETVKAFIVPKPGETLTEEEVRRYCKEKLAAYKVPKMFEFLDELPKSAVGKILRRELRDRELAKLAKG